MSSASPRSLLSRWGLPLLALALFLFAIYAVIKPGRTRADPPTPPPAAAASAATVAGIGIVEPASELIAIASELAGVVREVHVRPGEAVGLGAPLFRLDTREAEADLARAQAAVESARASVREAEVALADERQRYSLFRSVDDPRAISRDEVSRRRFAVERAEAGLIQARAAVRVAETEVGVQRTRLARLTVRAPMSGRVYLVNVRPGEFAPAGVAARPLITFGQASPLHVRVEIDEADAGRLRPGAAAEGRLRGRSESVIPLRFVRTEPQVSEKRALAGGAERVDTRVVQVLYSFDPVRHSAYLGQRMDVFVDAPRTATSPRLMANATVRP